MESKGKSLSGDGEWTVVFRSKGRQTIRKRKPKGRKEEEEKPWKSDDLEIDPERQARLKQKMEISMKKVETSKFYTAFLEQLKSPEVSEKFRLVIGAEKQIQMVMYGIGSIESYESPRLQLSIAILMRKEFDWVGENIEVFDPVLSATEASILESLGCTVLSVNEQARREALKPTLFFMPHCEANLYSNLLQANWRVDRLSNIALFGNSFQMYEEQVTLDPEVLRATKKIIAARRITSEFAIEMVSDDYFAAFHDSSWHFFSSGVDSELPLLVAEEKQLFMGSNPRPKKGREEEAQPWKPNELEVDPERQERLKQRMEVSMKTMESSEFYSSFLKQLKSPEVSEQFRRVLGNKKQLQMVIYGIGKIESRKKSRFQLSVALLMKREFDWVGENIEVFDPVLSATECSVLEYLGCTVLSVNEHGRREVLKPTLFFMPFCEATLHNNLLLTNWRIDRMSKMVLFGNSFKGFEEERTAFPGRTPKFMNFIKPMTDARKIVTEFDVETTMYDHSGAFYSQSWHFFSPGYRLRAANVGLRGVLDDNKDADLVYFQSNILNI